MCCPSCGWHGTQYVGILLVLLLVVLLGMLYMLLGMLILVFASCVVRYVC